MNKTLRKNITIKNSDYDLINEYAKKYGFSFSEALSKTAVTYISQTNDLSLLNFLNSHCQNVDDHEQKEIEEANIDFNDTDAKELTLDELL